MLESQGSYYDRFPVENMYPHSIELPDIITRMSREITRNATVLIKMLTLIQEDGIPTSDHNYTINRISTKLFNQFMLWEAHCKVDQEEYYVITDELEKAKSNREFLTTQRMLGEIDDEEFSLRLSISDWSIKNLSEEKTSLENNLKAFKNLKGLSLLIDIEDLYKMSKNDYMLLDKLELEQETLKLLRKTLSKILKTITSKNPSTL